MANERWADERRRYWDEDRSGYSRPDYSRSEPYEPRGHGYASGYGYGSQGYPEYEQYGEPYRSGYGQRRYGESYGRGYGGEYDYGRTQYGYGPGSSRRRTSEGWGGDYDQSWRGHQYEGTSSGWGTQRPWTERVGDELRSWVGDEDAERRRLMDSRAEYYSGRRGHSGVGPRGYTRSDERIREDVCDRLCDDWRVDPSDVEVNVVNGEVTLTGTVDSRQARRHAEDLADQVSGVRHVQNNIRVGQKSGSTLETTGTGTSSTTRGTH